MNKEPSQPGPSRLKVARFDSRPCGFPKPRISLLPDRLELQWPITSASRPPSQSSADQFRHFARGRYALGAAYQMAGVGVAGSLLAPAYHCITMLDPAIALGAEIVLYPLRADLSPDTEQLDAVLVTCKTPPRALLATHYFGRLQDFAGLRQWCDERGLLLIEDCSHVLLTAHTRADGAGTHGHFVVSSPYKFFPSADGGLLYAADASRLQDVSTQPTPLASELRGIKRTLEKLRPAKSPASSSDAIDRQLDTLADRPPITGEEQVIDYDEPSPLFSPALAQTAALRSSRFIVRHSRVDEAIRRRQANYRHLADALSALPNAAPLYREIAASDVPYMFPLRVAYPEPHFYRLKQLGVPIWRWDEMAVSDCAVAADYRLHLLHLPCHQSLASEQIDWMIAALEKTLRRPVQGVL